jgi:hypothetical protein
MKTQKSKMKSIKEKNKFGNFNPVLLKSLNKTTKSKKLSIN